jgi:hypothetical protein
MIYCVKKKDIDHNCIVRASQKTSHFLESFVDHISHPHNRQLGLLCLIFYRVFGFHP